MTNKLSELSKPVAYDYQIASACIADGHNKNGKWVDWNNKLTRHCPPDWMMEEGKVTGLKLLYSQEYVSALLAELEFEKQNNAGVAGMVEDYETKLAEKDKRIAELERANPEVVSELLAELESTRKQCQELSKQCGRLGARAAIAERKLATPVRLPDIRFIKVGETAVAVMHATSVKEQIQRAGFKVEGDE